VKSIRKNVFSGVSPAAAFSGSSRWPAAPNPKNCCGNATHAQNIYQNGPNA
jgi:hypothetical protein